MAISDNDLTAAICAESDRRQAWFADMVEKHPERMRAIVFAFLGDSIAYTDLLGIDPEAFLRDLRKAEPRAKPLPAAFFDMGVTPKRRGPSQ